MSISKLLLQKIFVFLVSIAVLTALLLAAVSVADRQVVFTNSRLEAAVRDALEKPDGPIFKSDLLTISRLDASGRGITRLEGIEAMRHLVILNLEDNRVEDLAPLRTLVRLRELNLRNNGISDLEEVNFGAVSTDLRVLNLRENRLTDITPLKELTELTELNLRENDIIDLSPLAGLTAMVYLNIHSNTRAASIVPLANLTSLQTLIMRNVPVGDEIYLLRNLTNLRRLNIRNCGITTTAVLAELMAAGALQDKPDKGIEAVVDIRGNTIFPEQLDSDQSIDEYWENINNRQPFSLSTVIFLEPPIFSTPGGFYENEFSLLLESNDPGKIILYTLDGSEPDINNVDGGGEPYLVNYFYPGSWETSRLIPRTNETHIYMEPIQIINRTGQKNDISNTITTYRQAPRIWWIKPSDNIYKGTVVKARTYDGESYSKTVTHSYFIGEKEQFLLPVFSITTDPKNLFDYDSGIYVPGKIYFDEGGTESNYESASNYGQRGREWERPAYIEYFDNHGELALSMDVGIRIHGGGSRAQPMKSLRLYARTEYDGRGAINYEFFSPNDTISTYKRLLLRGGGDVADHIRDAVAHEIMSNSKVSTQRNQPVIHFINGEYWGIAHIRDRLDRYYLAYRYNLDPDNIIILNAPWGIIEGTRGLEAGVVEDIQYYNELYSYAVENDLSKGEHYEYVKSLLDIDSYIDYNIMFIYLTNVDWYGITHYKFWRVREASDQLYGDGKWRIMVHDFDRAFEGSKIDLLANAIHPAGGGNDWRFGGGPDSPKTALLRNLLENQEFKYLFINRFADHINTTFHPDRVNSIIDKHYESIQEELDEHAQRWGYSAAKPSRVDSWKSFIRKRPDLQRQQIMENLGISGTAVLTLKTDTSKGIIRINTIEISENIPGVEDPNNWTGVYFLDIPVRITAVPNPGYRFDGWVETESSEAEITLALTEDLTLTASFAKQ